MAVCSTLEADKVELLSSDKPIVWTDFGASCSTQESLLVSESHTRLTLYVHHLGRMIISCSKNHSHKSIPTHNVLPICIWTNIRDIKIGTQLQFRCLYQSPKRTRSWMCTFADAIKEPELYVVSSSCTSHELVNFPHASSTPVAVALSAVPCISECTGH